MDPTATSSEKPWWTIVGLLMVVGVAGVAANLAAKRAYDLWKTGT